VTVRQTSLQAYREEQPRMGERQKLVLWFIRKFPRRTDRELTKLIGFTDPNQVRPRRKELLDAGLIYEAGRRPCTVSGKTALVWEATQ
jgi:hypothetical protein